MMFLANVTPIINNLILSAIRSKEIGVAEEESSSDQSKIDFINTLIRDMGERSEWIRLRSIKALLEFDFATPDPARFLLLSPLLKALEDESALVAWEATKVFGYFISCLLKDFKNDAIENLISILEKGEENGKGFADAEELSLSDIIQNDPGRAAIILGEIILAEVPNELKIKSIDPIIDLSKKAKKPSIKCSAIWALGKYVWTNASLDQKKTIIVTLIDFLKNKSHHIRYFSAKALRLFILSDIPSEGAALIVEPLVKAYSIEMNQNIKRIFMDLMADLAGSVPSQAKLELYDPIENALENMDNEIRDSAGRGNIYLGREFLDNKLKGQIQRYKNDLNSKDARVRAIAVLTLSNLSQLKAAEHSRAPVLIKLLEIVKDKAVMVRIAIVRCLPKFLKLGISDDLKKKAHHALIIALGDSNGSIRFEAAQARSLLEPASFIELLNEKNIEIRKVVNSELLKFFKNDEEKLINYIRSNPSSIEDKKSIRFGYNYDFSIEKPIINRLILNVIEKSSPETQENFIKRLLLTAGSYEGNSYVLDPDKSSLVLSIESVAFSILIKGKESYSLQNYLREIVVNRDVNIKIRRIAARLLGHIPGRYTERALKEVLGVGLFTPRDKDKRLCQIAFESLKKIREIKDE